MKKEDSDQCLLPKRRTGRIVQWIGRLSMWQILLCGLIAYLGLITVISTIECVDTQCSTRNWVKFDNHRVDNFWDIFYFNSITVLTIGYGDYVPDGVGARMVSILAAFLGTGILAITMSALVARFLSPPTNAIVFSKYAYYCTGDQKFMVIYLNTTQNRVVNADQAAYFNLKLSDKKLAATWNGGLPLLNRLLWANIESLPQKIFSTLVSRFTAPGYLLRAEKDKLVRVHQLNAKRTKTMNTSKRLRELGQNTMHNAFHHEALGFAREVKDKALTTFFTKRLSEIGEQMDADRIFPQPPPRSESWTCATLG